MSKCPFWSSAKEKVNCYKGCPMQPSNEVDDECVFKEHLVESKLIFKDIAYDDFEYNNYKDNYRYNLNF